jgi:hypothetical protein
MNLLRKSMIWVFSSMFLLSFGAASSHGADGDPDVKQEVRNLAAEKKLKESKDISLLYVKGLVCPSCALGIRIKVGKLPFVDSARYKRGVDMDSKAQLLTVALLPGAKPDNGKMIKAITDAGYEPAEWYSLDKGKLKAHPFAVTKKSK